MGTRVTTAMLKSSVLLINELTNSPSTSRTKVEGGGVVANIGNYHIAGAYEGVKLVRMTTEGGAIEDISPGGYVTKRALYNWMDGFICGLRAE